MSGYKPWAVDQFESSRPGAGSRAVFVLFAVVALLASVLVSLGPASDRATAADLSQFRPGNIISDGVFFDSATMTEGQIQSFLQRQVPSCQAGYVCLPNFRQDTFTRAANTYCSEYRGAAGETAAAIISKVADACGINPQVLIVMLQKEQGLVTHTWPSDWRYTIAMGQGCPDTAACDTAYYGFYNQVYGAARQMRVYGQSTYFTWYAPGKTWNVRYHPNANCGSAPVFIENQATANLYYYTPYQPNAAALRAGYGEGDACSAYGNRNFYNYFSDWFGSTQQSANKLVRGDGDSAVYLISDGKKYHVKTVEDLSAFQSRLGAVVRVPGRYTASIPSAGWITRYVHDVRSGTLYLLEADGSKHRFADAAQVAQFGYDFNSYVNLEPRLIDSFPSAAEVNDFRRISNGNDVFLYRDGSLRYIQSMEIWRALAGDTPLYAASMDAAAASAVPRGDDAMPRNALVRERDKPEVYLLGSARSAIYVSDLGLASDFGAGTSFVVNPGTLSPYAKAGGLGVVIVCGSQTFIASNGSAVPVSGVDSTGLQAAALPAGSCDDLPKAAASQTAPLFISVRGSGIVYNITQGKLRQVVTYDELVALNGSRPVNVLTWSPTTAQRVGYTAPSLTQGSFVQFAGSGEVYYVDQGALRHVRSYSTLLTLAGGNAPSVSTLSAVYRTSYSFGPAL